jgi:tripartite-type tricarboxylate transporter receptor subunit TctC
MKLHSWLFAMLVSCAPMAVAASATDGYPQRPVHIVTGGAGGGSDITARIVAQGISDALGQPFIVDNRAAGVTPGIIVSQATPDGYTLLVQGSTFWVAPLVQKTPYDPIKDFAPVILVNSAPNVLVVHPAVAANSVKEFVALAKARPGQLNYASGSSGGSVHLAGELFKAMAGIDFVFVPYKSAAQARTDLLNGQMQFSFATVGGVVPLVKAAKLKALGVSSAKPSALMPGLPTVAAAGVPGYESGTATGMFAPAGTPRAIVEHLNREARRFLERQDTRERFLNLGLEVVSGTPEAFGAAVKSEMARLGKVIQEAHIRAE